MTGCDKSKHKCDCYVKDKTEDTKGKPYKYKLHYVYVRFPNYFQLLLSKDRFLLIFLLPKF